MDHMRLELRHALAVEVGESKLRDTSMRHFYATPLYTTIPRPILHDYSTLNMTSTLTDSWGLSDAEWTFVVLYRL